MNKEYLNRHQAQQLFVDLFRTAVAGGDFSKARHMVEDITAHDLLRWDGKLSIDHIKDDWQASGLYGAATRENSAAVSQFERTGQSNMVITSLVSQRRAAERF